MSKIKHLETSLSEKDLVSMLFPNSKLDLSIPEFIIKLKELGYVCRSDTNAVGTHSHIHLDNKKGTKSVTIQVWDNRVNVYFEAESKEGRIALTQYGVTSYQKVIHNILSFEQKMKGGK